MIVELLRVQCGCGNTLAGLFDNHHAAIVAGERAGWLMQSESIGGDQCPRCLGREEVPFEEAPPVERLSAREAARRALPLTGSDAQALEGALAMTERERNEARAEVERLTDWADMLRLALVELDEARADLAGCIARGVELWEYAEALRDDFDCIVAALEISAEDFNDVVRERNEALDELEAARRECLRVAREQWDTNDNGAIDDADELAAYAEASDLRALAERESE